MGDLENNGQILAKWDLINTLDSKKIVELNSNSQKFNQFKNPNNYSSPSSNIFISSQYFWQRKFILNETLNQTLLQISINRTHFIEKITDQNETPNHFQTQATNKKSNCQHYNIFQKTFQIASVLHLWQDNNIKIYQEEYIKISQKLIKIKQSKFSIWTPIWQEWFFVLKKQIPQTLNQSDKLDRLSMIQTWKLALESLIKDWIKFGKIKFELENQEKNIEQEMIKNPKNPKFANENSETKTGQIDQNSKNLDNSKDCKDSVCQAIEENKQVQLEKSKYKIFKAIQIPTNIKNAKKTFDKKQTKKLPISLTDSLADNWTDKNHKNNQKNTTNSETINKGIAITGKFGLKRQEIVNLLEINNWKHVKVENSSYLLLGFKPSKKLQKAQKMGIEIINWQELIQILASD